MSVYFNVNIIPKDVNTRMKLCRVNPKHKHRMSTICRASKLYILTEIFNLL